MNGLCRAVIVLDTSAWLQWRTTDVHFISLHFICFFSRISVYVLGLRFRMACAMLITIWPYFCCCCYDLDTCDAIADAFSSTGGFEWFALRQTVAHTYATLDGHILLRVAFHYNYRLLSHSRSHFIFFFICTVFLHRMSSELCECFWGKWSCLELCACCSKCGTNKMLCYAAKAAELVLAHFCCARARLSHSHCCCCWCDGCCRGWLLYERFCFPRSTVPLTGHINLCCYFF